MTWTKQTRASLSGTSYGYGTQAWGTSPYGGQVATGDWTKQDRAGGSWTKQTRDTSSWTKQTRAS